MKKTLTGKQIMKKILIMLLWMVSSFSYATCTPPNGTYTGSFNGYYIDTKTGKYTEYASSVITMIFSTNGQVQLQKQARLIKLKVDTTATTPSMLLAQQNICSIQLLARGNSRIVSIVLTYMSHQIVVQNYQELTTETTGIYY